ncbi:MAG: LysE family translocator [Desulfobacteraceae bacterium]|nr:LysE family translocator [Desulfobacteraceae bacterium]
MNTATLLSFLLLSIVVCASPGPTMFFILSQGLSGNKKIALVSVLSVTVANIIWVSLSATGLAALIHSSVLAFEILRIIGTCYLIYLGVQIWKKGVGTDTAENQTTGMLQVFYKGLATSLSNPKALIFYLSFLPQFIQNDAPFFNQIMILGTLYVSIVFLVISFYAILGNFVISVLKQDLFKRMFGKVIGTIFILSGVALLKLKRI